MMLMDFLLCLDVDEQDSLTSWMGLRRLRYRVLMRQDREKPNKKDAKMDR